MSEEQLIQTPGVFGETGNFLLERELGRGGMGGVYMGRDKMLDRPVAVKVMLPEYGSDAAFVEKFKREAQAVARLIHPNIAQVYSYGIASGMPYIAMELVAGGSLDGLMKTKGAQIDVPRVMKICEQVAQALRCAADQGLVHGDVKPENILLDANGNAKLVDFGLAAMQKDTNEIWGTPYYIAPEKVQKQPVDYRADMYSLGGTIYHALTGVAPFEGDDAVAVVRKRFEGLPRPPSQVRPGLSPQIDALVLRMLALDPQERYPSFEALLEDFKTVMTIGLGSTSSISSTGVIPPAATATAGTEDGAAKPKGKKVLLKKRGGFKVKPKIASAGESGATEGGDDGVAELPEGEEAPKKKYSDEEEEEGGSVGLKVVGSVLGGIAVIGLIIGGLVWYQVADARAREREKQAQISDGYRRAKDAMVKTRTAALGLADSFDEFAKEALIILRKPTDNMTRMLDERYGAGGYPIIDPGPTPELLAAIASTNEAAKSEAAAKAAPADAAGGAAAPAAGGAAPAAAPAAPIEKFREPTEEEKDPMSPEGQKYAEEKAKWIEAQKAKAAAPAPAPEPEPQPAAAEGAAEGEAKPEAPKGPSAEVITKLQDMNALWVKAYGCVAASIEVRRQINALVKEIDAAVNIVAETAEDVTKLADKANEFKDRFDEINGSKIVDDAKKARGFITSRTSGDRSIVKQLEKQLRKEMLAEQRIIEEQNRILMEKAEKERREKERAARVEEEVRMAKDRFDAIVAGGKLRQLDWTSALAMLRQIELDMTLPEGEIQLNKEKRKIEAMKLAQDTMIRNMKGFKFTRGKPKDKQIQNLKGCTVESANNREIVVVRPNGTKAPAITWMKFYSDYHGNLDELISKYIRHGTVNASPKLSIKDWSNAMLGMALTMQIVCADNPTAPKFAEQLILEAAKGFSHDIPFFKEVFPDVEFSNVEADAE